MYRQWREHPTWANVRLWHAQAHAARQERRNLCAERAQSAGSL